MAKKSQFFRVAVEGATSDGRTIERVWLTQIAKHYDPKKYGARVNMEHIRGYSPNGDFKAYGDVLAVKTEEVEIGGVKKLALMAQIEPTDELVELVKKKQKLYTSIEVRPSFADSNEAYLTGLAVTDNPASLGTEMLAFAATQAVNPFAARKTNEGDLFAAAEEVVFEFSDDEASANGMAARFKSALDGAVALFTGKSTTDDSRFSAVADALKQVGTHFSTHVTAAEKHQADTDRAIADLRNEFKALKTQHDKYDSTPNYTQRPPATGGDAAAQTDF